MSYFFTWLTLMAIALDHSPKRISADHAEQAVEWVIGGVEAEDGSLEDAEQALEWMLEESGARPRARSGDGIDSCGVLQLSPGAARGAYSCVEVMDDPVLSVRLWLRLLRVLDEVCGSRFRALGAVSTGHCGGAPKLVAWRCAHAGGC